MIRQSQVITVHIVFTCVETPRSGGTHLFVLYHSPALRTCPTPSWYPTTHGLHSSGGIIENSVVSYISRLLVLLREEGCHGHMNVPMHTLPTQQMMVLVPLGCPFSLLSPQGLFLAIGTHLALGRAAQKYQEFIVRVVRDRSNE